MGVMRIDHPDIETFIRAKQPPKEAEPIFERLAEHEPGSVEWAKWYAVLQKLYRLTGFNVSVAITDDFMECLTENRPFKLKWGNKTYREIDPHNLWELIMRSTWDWAEPGALFIDQINRMNNLWYCERIAATNPCGEQPLPPYGACLLGSFNLVKYVAQKSDGSRYFDYEAFEVDIAPVVRAMDNVIDVAVYPLHEQEKEARTKRRMGLGVTGLANALEACGYEYGSEEFLREEASILKLLNRECYTTSALLGQEKGSFPIFAKKEYLQGQYVLGLDEDVREKIQTCGMRNSHLTSIAPTGTISMCADNVSSGIEPVFSYKQRRLVNMPTGQVEVDFDDYGFREFGVKGKTCDRVTIREHLQVLLTASQNVDSAVSKTCNVPADTPWADFKQLYVDAWKHGAKGITTYQVGGKRAGILSAVDEEPAESEEKEAACRIDPVTGRHECE